MTAAAIFRIIAVPLTLLSCLQPLHCLDEAIFILYET